MPRARRYIVPGHSYHVTHRCHDRAFLLKFKCDRNVYRRMLREQLQDSGITLFNHCITSNHVHLLLRPDPNRGLESISGFMQDLEGDFARCYNRRKKRQNAFWGDRYHATIIESGDHFLRCMVYIDLNMVRAGVVKHPSDWAWTGYAELMGMRKRYRMINTEQLLEQVQAPSLDAFRTNYLYCIDETIAKDQARREPMWTESLAVGSESFVEKVGRQVRNRMQVETTEDEGKSGSWILRETEAVYGSA